MSSSYRVRIDGFFVFKALHFVIVFRFNYFHAKVTLEIYFANIQKNNYSFYKYIKISDDYTHINKKSAEIFDVFKCRTFTPHPHRMSASPTHRTLWLCNSQKLPSRACSRLPFGRSPLPLSTQCETHPSIAQSNKTNFWSLSNMVQKWPTNFEF